MKDTQQVKTKYEITDVKATALVACMCFLSFCIVFDLEIFLRKSLVTIAVSASMNPGRMSFCR